VRPTGGTHRWTSWGTVGRAAGSAVWPHRRWRRRHLEAGFLPCRKNGVGSSASRSETGPRGFVSDGRPRVLSARRTADSVCSLHRFSDHPPTPAGELGRAANRRGRSAGANRNRACGKGRSPSCPCWRRPAHCARPAPSPKQPRASPTWALSPPRDVERALGYRWSPEGTETLALRAPSGHRTVDTHHRLVRAACLRRTEPLPRLRGDDGHPSLPHSGDQRGVHPRAAAAAAIELLPARTPRAHRAASGGRTRLRRPSVR